MTKIVARLEERGLVQRTPHPTDGRQVILAATPAGRSVLAQFERARDDWLARKLGELTAEERETLQQAAEILQKVARA
jgi:DNA-binding MarR family transcriptional regulator